MTTRTTSRLKRHLIGAALGTTALLMGAGSSLAETIIIGHFGNPTPMQMARAEGKFEAATGWDIEWRKFDAGTDVIAAMAAGDVMLAELGSSPTAIATSQGVDLQLFMLAAVLGTAESLIAREGSGIASLADLKGKKVGVPLGSTAHYSLMGALAHEGIAESDVEIMGMPPDQIAAAWEQGAIDAGFVWEPVQNQILQTGTRIIGADKIAEWGYPTFDAWVVNTEFAAANPDQMVAFAKVFDEANAAYLADPAAWSADSAPVKALVDMTGAAPDQVPGILQGFVFVPLKDQLDPALLGSAPAILKSTAEFLKGAGRIDTVADDYAPFVNLSVIEGAIK